jgi:diguanylate cyclase (GGDEF)-like protein
MSSETTDTAVAIEATPSAAPTAGPDQLLVLVDPSATRQWRLVSLSASPMRIGRGKTNNVVFDDGSVSSDHARLERVGANWALSDVGSRHGTFLNDVRLDGTRILRPRDRVRFGSVLVAFLSGAEVETERITQIAHAAEHDPLTGLQNRLPFIHGLPPEVRRAKRHGRPLSVIMLDVDHFKRINDQYGHAGGDSVLCEISRVLRARMREYDTVARYGGEEFAILMPEADLAAAKGVAEVLREAVANIAIASELGEIRPTISCGIAELNDADSSAEDLLRRSDEALYRAKHDGRNRVAD